MYKYCCEIDVSEGTTSTFVKYEVCVSSQYQVPRNELRKQVINRVPEPYDNFGCMFVVKEEFDEES